MIRVENMAKLSLPTTFGAVLRRLPFDLEDVTVISPKRQFNIMEMQLSINFYLCILFY
jgi:hypothetical protein